MQLLSLLLSLLLLLMLLLLLLLLISANAVASFISWPQQQVLAAEAFHLGINSF